MKTHLLLASIFAGLAVNSYGADMNVSRDTMADTWVATDGLRRTTPTNTEVGNLKPNKTIAMFYFTWLGFHGTKEVYDLSKILAGNPKVPAYGPMGAFHWWGEPYFGYYRSEDKWVIRKHMQMLADAGVDVIVCDVTNAFTYDATVGVLLETIADMRSKGCKAPAVSFITNSSHAKVVQHLYETWYKPGKYQDILYKWRGKPLLMSNKEDLSDEVLNYFEIRHSWAFSDEHHRKMWMGDGKEKWPWIDTYPQGFGWRESPDKPEEMPVSIATHPIAGVGRSHDGKTQPPEGKNDPSQGTYFQKQWDRALEVNPEVVFVTGWNEWVAQRFEWGKPHKVGKIGYRTPGEGESYFVDQMTDEFSRDAEPMKDGFGDNYYYQLVSNIRKFKGARPIPKAGPIKSIAMDSANLSDAWKDVSYVYPCDIGNTVHRNEKGFAEDTIYTNTTGRNDIAEVRVANDLENVYFYIQCVDAIRQPDGESRLVLLINQDADPNTGFAGFEIAVNRVLNNDKPTIEKVDVNLKQTALLGQADFKIQNNAMHIAIPRKLLLRDGKLNFDFKWADNLPADPKPMDFIDKGDCAPNGRFAYRYAE